MTWQHPTGAKTPSVKVPSPKAALKPVSQSSNAPAGSRAGKSVSGSSQPKATTAKPAKAVKVAKVTTPKSAKTVAPKAHHVAAPKPPKVAKPKAGPKPKAVHVAKAPKVKAAPKSHAVISHSRKKK